jgi:hypothetical protein
VEYWILKEIIKKRITSYMSIFGRQEKRAYIVVGEGFPFGVLGEAEREGRIKYLSGRLRTHVEKEGFPFL